MAIIAFASCQDEMDINEIATKPKMAVFCYPCPANDTTVITIQKSLPIKNSFIYDENDFTEKLPNQVVTLSVNGEQRAVEYANDTIGSVPKGNYFSVGQINEGDNITVEASADGVERVTSTTIVPKAQPILDIRTTTATHDNTQYTQLLVDIDGQGMRGNYYAVTVNIAGEFDWAFSMSGFGDDIEYVDPQHESFNSRQAVNVQDEPLLSSAFDDDMLFDFGSDFYGDFYIFDGNNVTTDKYTLRLNITNGWKWYLQDYHFVYNADINYVVRLYRIDPAMYKFFRSINELNGNDFAKYGLASFNTTYSNVKNGIGVVGAYNYSETKERIEYGD